MSNNKFGISSNISANKIDTSLLVQKCFLRTNYVEAKFEEDIDLKNQYSNKNLLEPKSIWETAPKNFVEDKFMDPSIKEKTTHVDFDDKNLKIVPFIKLNSISTLEGYLTPKLHVDQTFSNNVDESSLLIIDPD